MILPLLVITLLVSAAPNPGTIDTKRGAFDMKPYAVNPKPILVTMNNVDKKPTTVDTNLTAVDVYLIAGDTKSRIAIGKKAKSLFQQNCAKCHGRDGKGQTAKGQIAGAPDFTNGKWHELSEDQELASSIRHGRGMPSFGGKLNNEQIKTPRGLCTRIQEVTLALNRKK